MSNAFNDYSLGFSDGFNTGWKKCEEIGQQKSNDSIGSKAFLKCKYKINDGTFIYYFFNEILYRDSLMQMNSRDNFRIMNSASYVINISTGKVVKCRYGSVEDFFDAMMGVE